jgi:hypothetical protein
MLIAVPGVMVHRPKPEPVQRHFWCRQPSPTLSDGTHRTVQFMADKHNSVYIQVAFRLADGRNKKYVLALQTG